jgi:hypothetical protein
MILISIFEVSIISPFLSVSSLFTSLYISFQLVVPHRLSTRRTLLTTLKKGIRHTALLLACDFGLNAIAFSSGFPPILITALLFPFPPVWGFKSLSTSPCPAGFIDIRGFGRPGDVIVITIVLINVYEEIYGLTRYEYE